MNQAEELGKARVEHLFEESRNRSSQTADIALLGLKTLVLLNGGAIVALFTLLGHVDQLQVLGAPLWRAFAFFAAGVSVALVATILAFLASDAFGRSEAAGAEKIYFGALQAESQVTEATKQEARFIRRGAVLWWAAVVFAAFSIAGFAAGSAEALYAVSLRPAPQHPAAATPRKTMR